ncbi:MAG: MJ0042-type zinc finger domain-containing protein, partial [Woeseiaceae bacterium]
MYTQCPECGVAFRVTADILKQAAGKVRCGGCRRAFNALDYLSESKPEAPLHADPEPQLPELIPEPDDDLDAERTPRTISAEQSAALLKTLDQLAGEDIRIEDTGVEWRVLDLDDDDSQTAQDEHAAVEPADTNTGSLKFILQDAETGDSEEIREPDAPVSADVDGETDIEDAGRIEFESAPAADEMRFDDNTQLPDDFGSDVEEEPEAEPMIEVSEPPGDPDDPQVDLALGDPDEWQDLLGEVGGEDVPVSAAEAAEFSRQGSEAVSSVAIESRSPADGPLDTDTQFAIQAETLGIDLSGLHTLMDEDDLDQYPETGADQSLYKEDDTETSLDEDLIAAAFEVEAAARDTSEARKPADTEQDPGRVEDDTDDDLTGDTELGDAQTEDELTRDVEFDD